MYRLVFVFLYLLMGITAFSQNFKWLKGISAQELITYETKVDIYGNILEIGRFSGSVDFDPGPDVEMLYSNAPAQGLDGSIYVTKQNSDGDLIWAKVIQEVSSINDQYLRATLCTDNDGNVFIAGRFQNNVDFDPNAGINNLFSFSGSYYIAKWDFDGNHVWSKQFCSESSAPSIHNLTLASNGVDVFLGGSFSSVASFKLYDSTYPDLPDYRYSNGGLDAFVMSIANDGSQTQWVNTMGSFGDDTVEEIEVTFLSNVIVNGTFETSMDANPGVGAYQINGPMGLKTPFVINFSYLGDFITAKSYPNTKGLKLSYASEINKLFVAGNFNGDLNVSADNSPQFNISGVNDVFVCNYSDNLIVNWVKTMGGPNVETVTDLAAYSDLGVYLVGTHNDQTDLDPGINLLLDTIMGAPTAANGDNYIMRIGQQGILDFVETFNYNTTSYDLFNQMPLGIFNGISISNTGDIVLGILMASDLTDFDLSALSVQNPTIPFVNYGYKVCYGQCMIQNEELVLSGPESSEPGDTVDIHLYGMYPEQSADWFLTQLPLGWEVISFNGVDHATLLAGTENGSFLVSVFDGCGNSTVLLYELVVDDILNPTDTTSGVYSFRLVKDIHDELFDEVGSDPQNFVSYNNLAYFIADEGSRLWVSDGSETGTQDVLAGSDLVVDLIVGVLNNKMILAANHPSSGLSLWISDGTLSGTTLLYDVTPGNSAGMFQKYVLGDSYLYFLADNGINGTEWWVTDGTGAGTYMVADLSTSGFLFGCEPIFYGNSLLFGAEINDIARDDLWIIGPQQGAATNLTEQFNALYYEELNVSELHVFNGMIFFDFYKDNEGRELFVSNGTVTGTSMIDLFPGTDDSYPRQFKFIDNTMIFDAYRPNFPNGCLIFFKPDFTYEEFNVKSDVLANHVIHNGVLYFSGFNQSDGNELWRTDGTVQGTWRVADIMPGTLGSAPSNLSSCGDKLYFVADSGTEHQPFVSDGTADGTFMLTQLFYNSTVGSYGHDFTYLNGNTFFIARNAFTDFQVFVTDGTTAGTQNIFAEGATNFSNPVGEGDITVWNPGQLYLVGDKIFIPGDYHNISRELYVIDSPDEDTTVFVAETQINTSVEIYPQPVSNKLNIVSNGVLLDQIVVYDIKGKLIDLFYPVMEKYEMDVCDFPDGVYIIRLESKYGVQVKRVIVAK